MRAAYTRRWVNGILIQVVIPTHQPPCTPFKIRALYWNGISGLWRAGMQSRVFIKYSRTVLPVAISILTPTHCVVLLRHPRDADGSLAAPAPTLGSLA